MAGLVHGFVPLHQSDDEDGELLGRAGTDGDRHALHQVLWDLNLHRKHGTKSFLIQLEWLTCHQRWGVEAGVKVQVSVSPSTARLGAEFSISPDCRLGRRTARFSPSQREMQAIVKMKEICYNAVFSLFSLATRK